MKLEPLKDSDFDAILRLVEQPGVSHFLVDSPSLGRERLTMWFERSAKAFKSGHMGLFAIRETRSGETSDEIVGFAGLLVLDPGRPEDEYLLYAIDAAHRGRGLATQAARKVVELTRFTRTRRLVATVDRENPASIRVMQKLGFSDGGLVAGENGDLRVFTLELK